MKIRLTLTILLALCAFLNAETIPLTAGWRFATGDNPAWSKPGFNHNRWKEIPVGKTWEEAGYPGYDGYAWYRIRVRIPAEIRNDPYVREHGYLILFLGPIDDADQTFFNGEEIGRTGSMPPQYASAWEKDREYRIPLKLVRWNRDNTIAIRVYDAGGGGGLYKGKPTLKPPGWKDFVPMTIGLGRGDGVFPFGTPMHPSCFVSNGSLGDLEGSLSCILEDEEGKTIAQISKPILLPRFSATNLVFESSATAPGLYKASFFMKTGEKGRTASLYLGYGLDRIDRPLTRQKDFQTFWDRTRAELAKVPPEFKVTEKPELSANGVKVYLIEMKSLGNALIRGWYSVPDGPGPFPAILQVPGHSSELGPVTGLPDFAVFSLNIRGHGNSKDSVNPGFPGYLIHGLESPETYIYRGAYMDCLRAVDFLVSRPEVDKKRIAVEGGSQGGALSFAAAALDPRIALCAPDVPFLSDFQTYFAITGWPGFEFKNYCASRPGFSEKDMHRVLSYFDIMNLAPGIRVPVFMSSGLQDRVCPAIINFAAFNKVPGEKEARVYPFGGHEGGGGIHWQAKFSWIRKKFGISQ